MNNIEEKVGLPVFDRLQLVRGLANNESGVFETREEAINYVIDKQNIERPSLEGEPIILRYESGDAEKGPNVILAIGSVGDGSINMSNRTFFIDTQKTEEEIEALGEDLENAIKSLTLIPLESDTIKFFAEKTDDGTYVSGDTKFKEYVIGDDLIRRDNIIQKYDEGLYTFVDLDYDEKNFRFTFTVNQTSKEFQIPPDQHVVSGRYSTDKESIILTLADGSEVSVELHKLIDEWTVLPDSTTPIVLSKEHHSGTSEDKHDGIYDWQDVLTADVRVATHMPHNIITKTQDGRYLYVRGAADNIAYGDSNVETVLKQLEKDTKISDSLGNIIYRRQDGIYAYTKLDYDATTNKIKFSYSNGGEGKVETVEYQLNSMKIFDRIFYDASNEEIVIFYKDNNNEEHDVRIPVGDLIEEWEVNSVEHSVKLEKTRNAGKGADVLTADVKIREGHNNILEDFNHELYVNGIADNIKYDVTGDTTVKDVLDTIDDRIKDGVNTRITTVEAKDASVEVEVTPDGDDKKAIVGVNISKENDKKVDTSVLEGENILSWSLDKNGNEKTNIIKLEVDGLHADVDLNYDVDGNALYFSKTGMEGVKKIQLQSNTVATDESYYDPKTEELVLKYYYNDGQGTGEGEYSHDLRISLKELIEEWYVTNTSTVNLSRERHEEVYADNLYADVKVDSTHDDNLIEVITGKEGAILDEGGLYVSGGKIDEKISDRLYEAVSLNNAIEITNNVDDEHGYKKHADIELKVSKKYGMTYEFDKTNIITIEEDGIHADVNLRYDPVANKLYFSKTGMETEKEIELQTNSVVDEIYYDYHTESIIIKYKANGVDKTSSIPMRGLLNEWDAVSTPTIELVRGTNDLAVDGTEQDDENGYRIDSLSAKVKVDATHEDNILEVVDAENGGLYVSGQQISDNKDAIEAEVNRAKEAEEALSKAIEDANAAIEAEVNRAKGAEKEINETIGTGFTSGESSNITFKFNELSERVNANAENADSRVYEVKPADSSVSTENIEASLSENNKKYSTVKVNLSETHLTETVGPNQNSRKNIIVLENDGLHVDVDLTYDSVSNTLYFSKTGSDSATAIPLQSQSLIDSVAYDPFNETIVIKYTVNGNAMPDVIVPVKDLIEEWTVGNTETIILDKKRNEVTGESGNNIDLLTASVRVHEGNNNILSIKSDGLYVSGDDIDKNKGDIASIQSDLEETNTKLEDEIKRSKDTDEELKNTIGTGFTSDEHDNVTYKFEQLNTKVDDEIKRSTEKDTEQDGRLDSLDNYANNLSADTNDRVYDVRNFEGDKSVVIENVAGTDTDKKHSNIKVNLSTIKGSETDTESGLNIDRNNIIKLLDDGLHADVDLQYNALTNTLYFSKTGSEGLKEIQLASDTIIKKIEYDAKTEELILTYTVNGKDEDVRVSVRGILDEWRVSSTTTVTLYKEVNHDLGDETHSLDILTAEVNISSNETNILEVRDGGLFVSNSAITENSANIATAQADIEELKTKTSEHDDAISGLTEGLNNVSGNLDTLSGTVETLSDNLDEVSGKTDANTDDIEEIFGILGPDFGSDDRDTVSQALKDLENKLTENANTRLTEVKAIDTSVIINNSENGESKYAEVGVNLVDSANTENIIRLTDLGLYANVDLTYDKNSNVLKFSKSGYEDKEIALDNLSRIKSITYNSETENLDVVYKKGAEETETVSVPLRGLIDEWDVNKTDGSILLTKTKTVGEGPDILTAEVVIDTHHEDNILENHVGEGLYVSSSAITANANEIENLKERVSKTESDITNISGAVDTTNAKLDSEITRASAKEHEIEDNLEKEVNRATGVENDLQRQITENKGACTEKTNGLQNKLNEVESNLNTEIERAKTAEQELRDSIKDETNRAQNAETALDRKIDTEIQNARAIENSLQEAINNEIANRESADNTLRDLINNVSEASSKCCDEARDLINKERDRAIAEENRLNKAITDEAIRATNADNELIEKITKEVTDRTEAVSSLEAKITVETNRALAAESVLDGKIEGEIARAKGEEKKLEDALNKEIEDRRDAIEGLEDAIRDATLTFADTTSVKLTKSETNVVTANVKVANSDDNIIVIDGEKEGVYASVKLSYNPGTNKIKLITSKGEQEEIQLNAGTLIDDMVYDSVNRTLIMTYRGADGSEHTVKFPVNDLFNDWMVENPSEDSAIELTKELGGPGLADKLSGRVLLTNLEDNAISIVNNGLYVSSSAMTEAVDKAKCTEQELKAVEKAVFGRVSGGECGEDFEYDAFQNGTYIDSASSVHNATFLLDQAINNLSAYTENIYNDQQIISSNVECIKKELDITQENVLGMPVPECGVKGDGTPYEYVPNKGTNYIWEGESFNDTDIILDREIKKANDLIDKVSGDVLTVSGDVINIQIEVDQIEASIGLAADGTYPPHHGCGIISGATTLIEADGMLEAEVCRLRESLNSLFVGSDTVTTHMYVIKEGLNNYIYTDVRLSHGNGTLDYEGMVKPDDVTMTDEDFTITNYTGDTVESTEYGAMYDVYEFSDTNVLRIVDIKADNSNNELKPTAKSQGLYLTNNWNCGLYTVGGEGTFDNRYQTDEADGASDYDYNNNVRR